MEKSENDLIVKLGGENIINFTFDMSEVPYKVPKWTFLIGTEWKNRGV